MSWIQKSRRIAFVLPLAVGLVGCGGGGTLNEGTSTASEEDIAKAKAANDAMNAEMAKQMQNPNANANGQAKP